VSKQGECFLWKLLGDDFNFQIFQNVKHCFAFLLAYYITFLDASMNNSIPINTKGTTFDYFGLMSEVGGKVDY